MALHGTPLPVPVMCGEAISRVLTVRQGVPASLTRWGCGMGILAPGVQPSWSPHAAMAAGHSHCPGHGPQRKMGGTPESHVHSEVFFPSCSHVLAMLQRPGDVPECLLGHLSRPQVRHSGTGTALGSHSSSCLSQLDASRAIAQPGRVAAGLAVVGTARDPNLSIFSVPRA